MMLLTLAGTVLYTLKARFNNCLRNISVGVHKIWIIDIIDIIEMARYGWMEMDIIEIVARSFVD